MDIIEEPVEIIEEAVKQLDLLHEQKLVILEIFEWVKRMTKKYGNTVTSKNGEVFDWGQALCREQFGPDWQNVMIERNISIPTKEDLARGIEWENGKVPDWVKTS